MSVFLLSHLKPLFRTIMQIGIRSFTMPPYLNNAKFTKHWIFKNRLKTVTKDDKIYLTHSHSKSSILAFKVKKKPIRQPVTVFLHNQPAV
jgi:hypothetical protein